MTAHTNAIFADQEAREKILQKCKERLEKATELQDHELNTLISNAQGEDPPAIERILTHTTETAHVQYYKLTRDYGLWHSGDYVKTLHGWDQPAQQEKAEREVAEIALGVAHA